MDENKVSIAEKNYKDIQDLKNSLIVACQKKVAIGEIDKVVEYIKAIGQLDEIMGKTASYFDTFSFLQSRRYNTEINLNSDDVADWLALVEDVKDENTISSSKETVPED